MVACLLWVGAYFLLDATKERGCPLMLEPLMPLLKMKG